MGSKVLPYQLDILSPKLNYISPILWQLLKLLPAAYILLIAASTFAHRQKQLGPECRELNSDLFALEKNLLPGLKPILAIFLKVALLFI